MNSRSKIKKRQAIQIIANKTLNASPIIALRLMLMLMLSIDANVDVDVHVDYVSSVIHLLGDSHMG